MVSSGGAQNEAHFIKIISMLTEILPWINLQNLSSRSLSISVLLAVSN